MNNMDAELKKLLDPDNKHEGPIKYTIMQKLIQKHFV